MILIVRTDHDPLTHYLHGACEPIILEAQKRSCKLVDVDAKSHDMNSMTKLMKKLKPAFVLLNGHGSPNAFYRTTKDVLLDATTADALKGAITYARSCECLIGLGKAAVKSGCRAFIGYRRLFWLPKMAGMLSRSQQDRIAGPVVDASNLVAESIIRGQSVENSIRKSHELTAKMMLDLIYSQDPYDGATLAAISMNDSSLDYEGDGGSVL
jgi:hypothetical protein